MKLHLDCIPCFQRQALEAARMITSDEKMQKKVLRAVMKELMRIDWEDSPPKMAYKVHMKVKQVGENSDPYKVAKKNCNDVGLSLYPSFKEIMKKATDPLLTGIKLAIAGNIMDFGALSDFDIQDTISRVLKSKFAIDDYSVFRARLKKTDHLYYLLDNAGEIVFDKILLEYISSFSHIKKITVAVKREPMLNDATCEDVTYVGLDRVPKLDFIETGIDELTEVEGNKDITKMLAGKGMTICKGQGNYEALSEYRGFFFLLIAKCPVVADDLGVRPGDIILMAVKD